MAQETNMAEERFYLTKEGYATLERELQILRDEERQKLAEQLADVHEDTEYGEEATFFDVVTAKERLEQRINYLRRVLGQAEIIGDDPNPMSVDPGERVTVWDFEADEETYFDLLSGAEIAAGRRGVSVDSPVGRALLGKQVGDVFEVEVPDGVARYAIRKIERLS
jgi:transcription elongation factor GreA